MARFLLFVAFLNASAAVVLDRRRISFYTCSFFKFACFAAVLKWKSLNFTAEKISNLWHQVQKKLRVKSRRSHSNSHLKSRENQTDNTSPSSEPELLLSPEGGQYQQSGALHYISGHWKLFVGEYFTNKQKSFVGHWVWLCSQPIKMTSWGLYQWEFCLFSANHDPLLLSEIRDRWKNKRSLPLLGTP